MSRRDGSADAPLCSFRSPSSRCTKPEKGVKRAGFNSPSVLKTRKAQTRTPKTPSREGCAFYPLSALFPASTSKIPPYSLAREVHSSPLMSTRNRLHKFLVDNAFALTCSGMLWKSEKTLDSIFNSFIICAQISLLQLPAEFYVSVGIYPSHSPAGNWSLQVIPPGGVNFLSSQLYLSKLIGKNG